MSTIRQSIMDALQNRLQSIVQGNSVTVFGDSYTYQQSVGTVAQWRANEAWEESDLPAVNIKDVADPLEEESVNNQIDHKLIVEIQFEDGGSFSVNQARDMLRDMLKAIGSDETFGGLAYLTEPSVSEFMVDIKSQRFAGFSLNLVISYRTDRFEI